MKQNGSFFLDLLSIIPLDGTVCCIQAPDIEGLSSVLSETDDPTLMLLKTDSHSREIIKKAVQQNNIQDYMQYIIFTDNGRTIFEGYDGLEYGIFSNSFDIPHWFAERYEQKDIYGISTMW